MAQYALGDDGNGETEIVAPIEERVIALLDAIEATETHLLGFGFDASRLLGAKGFARIEALKDAVDAVYTSDEAKRRFEILARQIFIRFKALLMESSAEAYAERHDNIEAIYKKLTERRDTSGVTWVRQHNRPLAMTESKLPSFSPKASIFWAAIPVEIKQKILANVYCAHCRGAVSIINFTGAVKGGDLVLQGSCAVCGHKVARLVEGSDA